MELAAALWQMVPVTGHRGSGDLRTIASTARQTARDATALLRMQSRQRVPSKQWHLVHYAIRHGWQGAL